MSLNTRRVLVSVFAVVVASAAFAAPQTASDYNAVGVEHYNAGEHTQAIEAFYKAYQLAPENPTIRRNISNAYHALSNEFAKVNDFGNAIRLLEDAIPYDPLNPLPLVQLGAFYLRTGNVNDAIFRIEEALELDPDNEDAHALLGDAFYRNNQLAQALAEWEWVMRVNPKRPGLKEKIEKAQREDNVEYDFRNGSSRHFEISFGRGTSSSESRNVLQILERAYREIGLKFGRVYPPDRINVIAYTADEFGEATQLAEHVGALYDGKIRVPLSDKSGASLPKDELTRRLYHEYTHVVVRHIVGDNIPWWVNEGLAQEFSEDLNQHTRDLLLRAKENGVLFTLRQLEKNQLRNSDATAVRLAYAQAHAAVNMLHSRFGVRRMLNMLNMLADGVTMDEALRQTYRRTYELLEREVSAHIG